MKYIYRISVFFRVLMQGSITVAVALIRKISTLFLINEKATVTVIDPCINIQKKTDTFCVACKA